MSDSLLDRAKGLLSKRRETVDSAESAAVGLRAAPVPATALAPKPQPKDTGESMEEKARRFKWERDNPGVPYKKMADGGLVTAADLAEIVPDTGPVAWYCHASGCDYTLRVTYADQSVRHVLVRGGYRPWFDPEGAPEASADDPTSGDSYRVFGVNVPGDQALLKLEVLATPMGWNGVAPDAAVLLSRDL